MVVVMALVAIGAAPAYGAPPPTLTGQAFGGSYFSNGGVPSSMSLSCTTNADGTTTLSWRTEPGPSSGPYAGQDQETGEMRIRRHAPPNAQVDVLSLKADFTVDSPTGR